MNYLAILVCTILSIVIGSLWYGMFFGKLWMNIIGVNPDDCKDPVKRKEMNKKMVPMYAIQIITSLLQVLVLAYVISYVLDLANALISMFVIWTAGVLPTIVGGIIWTNDSRKVMWQKFLLQAGYQLISFIAFGLILGMWR